MLSMLMSGAGSLRRIWETGSAGIAAICIIAAVTAAHPVRAGSDGATVIVLDATNSMWGRLGNTRKIFAARDAIIASSRQTAGAPIGVYVIGGNPQRRCEDVTEVVRPGPVTEPDFGAAMRQVRPGRGRMPLIAGMNRGADVLEAHGRKGKIVIIADGADNCAENACAAARDFAKRNPAIEVHIISLARTKAMADELRCIANAAGGMYHEAESEDALAAALTAAVSGSGLRRERAGRRTAEFSPGAPPVPERNPTRRAEGVEAPNVILRAALAPGSPPLAQGLSWRIMDRPPTGQEEPEVVWRGADPEPALKLPEGRYYVEVSFGLARAEREFEVDADGVSQIDISLDAATLKLAGVAVAGGQPLDNVFYYLYLVKDAKPAATPLGRSSQAQPTFYLPAGDYLIIAEHGYATAQIRVSLRPGQVIEKSLQFGTGRLRLSARLSSGGLTPEGVFFYVYRRGDPRSGDMEVARSALPEPVFALPAGDYRVVARLDSAEARADVRITPDNETTRELVLEAGLLRLASQLAGQSGLLSQNVIYRIYSAADTGKERGSEVAVSARAEPGIYLNAGRYRVTSTLGRGNAVEEATITVEPGKTTSITLTHEAGAARVALVAEKGGLPLGRVRWTIRDARGQQVFATNEPSPELILRTGQYVAVAERGGREWRTAFTVRANQMASAEIVAK